MWMEELPNGKYKFFERYKDPYTEKWKRVSVTLDSGSSRAKKEAQKLLDERIEETLQNIQSTDVTYQHVLDEWWTFYQKEIKGSSISSLTSSVNDFKEAFDTEIKVKNIDTKYIQRFLNDLDISRSKLERYKMILNLSLDYAVNLLLKHGRLLTASKYGVDEFANLLFRKKIIEKNEWFSWPFPVNFPFPPATWKKRETLLRKSWWKG